MQRVCAGLWGQQGWAYSSEVDNAGEMPFSLELSLAAEPGRSPPAVTSAQPDSMPPATTAGCCAIAMLPSCARMTLSSLHMLLLPLLSTSSSAFAACSSLDAVCISTHPSVGNARDEGAEAKLPAAVEAAKATASKA